MGIPPVSVAGQLRRRRTSSAPAASSRGRSSRLPMADGPTLDQSPGLSARVAATTVVYESRRWCSCSSLSGPQLLACSSILCPARRGVAHWCLAESSQPSPSPALTQPARCGAGSDSAQKYRGSAPRFRAVRSEQAGRGQPARTSSATISRHARGDRAVGVATGSPFPRARTAANQSEPDF